MVTNQPSSPDLTRLCRIDQIGMFQGAPESGVPIKMSKQLKVEELRALRFINFGFHGAAASEVSRCVSGFIDAVDSCVSHESDSAEEVVATLENEFSRLVTMLVLAKESAQNAAQKQAAEWHAEWLKNSTK